VIQALGTIGDPAARPAVRPFLKDREERRRLSAAGAAAALRDTSSVPVLAALLSDSLLTVRSAAYEALRQFGASSIRPVADRLRADGCPRRVAHVRALAKVAAALADSSDALSLDARYVARQTLLAELERRSARAAASRAAAVEGLIALGDEETLAAVRMRMADEPDALVQRTFSEAMKRRETEE
jgi:HEAT repeat protein